VQSRQLEPPPPQWAGVEGRQFDFSSQHPEAHASAHESTTQPAAVHF
jgi:hypothetical protein